MRVLVTGGSGTFGRAFIRRFVRRADAVVSFSRDEQKAAALCEEFKDAKPFKAFLGDVRDRERLQMAMSGVDVVVHAAALKRIDVGAYSPGELVKTNIFGTMNVVNAAIEARVRSVVVISSDKAVAPTNLYGATKYCTSPDTPILMADLSWKPARDLRLGDAVIGVDERVERQGSLRKLRRSVIRKVTVFGGQRVRVTTNRGSVVVTPDHKFLARDPNKRQRNVFWTKTSDLRIGHLVKHIGEPWIDKSDSWLAGIIDGEGSLAIQSRSTSISIGQNLGPVLDRIEQEMLRLGVSCRLERKTKCRVAVTSNICDVLRVLGSLRPTRMIGRVEELLKGGKATGQDTDAVVEAIEPLDEGEMIGFATTTKTLITNGFVSHNCAETYAVQANAYGYPKGTKISCVRYGNIIGSRGSVYHIWKKQAEQGVPLTMTDPNMTRFVMTIEEAVDLVDFSITNAEGGEVFIPMLPACAMGSFAAAAVGNRKWEIIGRRPGGEKDHESLLNEEEIFRTRYAGKYLALLPTHREWTSDEYRWNRPFDRKNLQSDDPIEWAGIDKLKEMLDFTEACR